jgi:uncharacterized repeat protein (TIGR04138 family)
MWGKSNRTWKSDKAPAASRLHRSGDLQAMIEPTRKSVEEVARELGRYSLEAFEFLHQGLDFTVRHIHGAPDPALAAFGKWMEQQGISADDLESLIDEQRLPEQILEMINHYGGVHGIREKLNRHVGGQELCWGLRDLAMRRWGLMAPAVLGSWGIRQTRDFGRMVFALVDNNILQKQPEDRLKDFDNVYSFDTAFTGAYKIADDGDEPETE